MTDVRVFHLIENGRVAITAVVHVDDIFAVGQKERCDRLCVDLNRTIPVKNLGDLQVVWRMPILEGSQKGYSNDIPTEFPGRVGEEIRVTSIQSVPLRAEVKLEQFDDEETESWPFRELICC